MFGKDSKSTFLSAKNVCYFAVLLALILVLQLSGAVIKIGATQLTFVLVPIVLGGMLLGPFAGGALGFSFGLIVLLQGIFGADAFTMILFNDNPIITTLLCTIKGTACGLASGLVYKLLSDKNQVLATFIASAVAPVVNTGLFIIGALFMSDTLNANFVEGTTVIYFLVIICAGVNFLIELAINLILAPTLLRIVKIVEKYVKK